MKIRSIDIPLFIPESIYQKLNDQGFIEESEYNLERNYETNHSKLWNLFNNIGFKLIPIKSLECEQDG